MKVKIRVQLDSSSAVMVTAKRGLGRLRHIQMRQLWFQEEIRAGRSTVEHVMGETNVADLLTKALPTARFYYLAELTGMVMKPIKDDSMMAPIERFGGGMIPIDLEMWIAEVEKTTWASCARMGTRRRRSSRASVQRASRHRSACTATTPWCS